jgi:predicted phage-related endonuclease
MYPDSRPGTVQSLDDVQGAVIGLRAAREDLKAARQAEDECKAIIAATLADAEEGTIDGKTAVTYRSHDRRDIDVDRLRLRHPDIAERYTTVTTVRTMRTPEVKT